MSLIQSYWVRLRMRLGVVDTFHLTCQSQSLETPSPSAAWAGSLSEDEVSSLLSSFDDWKSVPRQRAASLADHLTTLAPSGRDTLPFMFLSDLQSHQQQGSIISRVRYYVERRRRPSRCERCDESPLTLRVLKQWDRLTLLNGILYSVTRDPLTK